MKPIFSNLKGDFKGALAAAVITLPMSIGYGLIAFAALGPDFAPAAALTGVYSAVFCGFFAAMTGGTPIQISGPKAPLTLLLAATVAQLAATPHIQASGADRHAVVWGLASLCVLLAGISQIILARLKLGKLVKFVPFPVVSGFMNGIAILLIAKQLKPLAGLEPTAAMADIAGGLESAELLSLGAGLGTVAAYFASRRLTRSFPASLAALLTGTAICYLPGLMTATPPPFATIGAIRIDTILPHHLTGLFRFTADIDVRPLLPVLLTAGLFIGLIGALESLLSSVVADDLAAASHDSSRELRGQGIGNIIGALFGAIPAAGSIPRSLASFSAGARTRLAGMLAALMILSAVLMAGPLVGMIPIPVIAGIVTSVGITLFDWRTLSLLASAILRHRLSKEGLANLLIMVAVTVSTVTFNLTVAIAVGITAAAALFVAKMGQAVIRRRYTGAQVRSKNSRNAAQAATLEQHGHRIAVFELQGPLFFGSAENLAAEVQGSADDLDICILDLKRVNMMDSTGANILGRIHRNLTAAGKQILISYLHENRRLWHVFEEMRLTGAFGEAHIFADTDAALEWAENRILSDHGPSVSQSGAVEPPSMAAFEGLSDTEMAVVQNFLIPERFRKDQLIFRKGDDGRDVYFIAKGSVSVFARLPMSKRYRRINKYHPGTIVGEMALLDGRPRSADVKADEDTLAYKLAAERFDRLSREHPEIAMRLALNIAREISMRLRIYTREIQSLEEG